MYAKQASVRRKEKMERLALIKQRHRRLILEGRQDLEADGSGDLEALDLDFDLDFDLDLN